MSEPNSENPSDSFRDWLERIRRKEPEAETLLFQKYSGAISRVFRVRGKHRAAQRYFSSQDVLQEVMCRFYEAVRRGDAQDIDSPAKLNAYLITIARRKFIDYVRFHLLAEIRGAGLLQEEPAEGWQLADGTKPPLDQVERQELLTLFEESLTERERQIWSLQKAGHSPAEIAEQVGLSAANVRMIVVRAIQAFAEQHADR